MRRTRLKPVSKKRAKQNVEYLRLRDRFLYQNPFCMAKVPGTCGHWSVELHHMVGRVGEMLLNEEHIMAICSSCHRWIHDNPKEAKEKGWKYDLRP
jgi:5-methylcytosine-specific restriction endonuclease McrA